MTDLSNRLIKGFNRMNWRLIGTNCQSAYFIPLTGFPK